MKKTPAPPPPPVDLPDCSRRGLGVALGLFGFEAPRPYVYVPPVDP
jgi:hypothetical protein